MTILTQATNFRWSASYTPPPLWTPANIDTALWLDASDASTITTVSGAVSQWNDKSGNNRNATQSTAASRPAYTTAGLNGLATVTPDGSNDWMTCSPVFSGTTPDNYFVIAALRMLSIINSGLNTDNGLFYQTGSTVLNSNIYFHLAVSGSSNKPLTDLFPPSGGSLLAATATTANTSYLFATSRTSGTRAIWINGAIDASQTGAETYTGETTVATDLFMLRGSNHALNAHVGEIIALAYPSQANRERIEGYLAHKWGLAGSLPAGHPYKSAPPYYRW